MVLLLRHESVSIAVAVPLHPERADVADEAIIGIGFPAVGSGVEGLGSCIHGSDLPAERACWIGGSATARSGYHPAMQFTPAPHITQHWQLTKPEASGRRGLVVSQCKEAADA